MRVLALVLAVLCVAALPVRIAPLAIAIHLVRAELLLDGIHGRTIRIDGTQIHYLEGGEGEPVVLVHGLGGSAEQDWSGLLPQLVRSGHHVYALDLPGFGDSDRPRDRSYSIREQAAVVAGFLDAHDLGRVTLAGDSMGGWIAAKVALDRADRVVRLILLDSAGWTFRPDFDLAVLTPRTNAQVDAMLGMLFPNPPDLPDFVKRDFIRDAERGGWVIDRAVHSMLTGADLIDRRFSALRIPLLIVWGKQDALTPVSLAEAMHRSAPQSVLEIYDGCGHASIVSCSDRIGPKIVDFLLGSAPPPGHRIEIPVATI